MSARTREFRRPGFRLADDLVDRPDFLAKSSARSSVMRPALPLLFWEIRALPGIGS
jgi:hypothetical protein